MKRTLLASTVILPITASMAFANNFLNVDQTISNSTQKAANSVSVVSNSEDLDQDATNVGNLVDQAIGGGTVDQAITNSTQDATNSAIAGNRWSKVDQAASSLANIVQGSGFGDVDQSMSNVGQIASNLVSAGAGAYRIDQAATNVGNLVSSEMSISAVDQSVSGTTQAATNDVSAGTKQDQGYDAYRIDQVGTNLLNIVEMNNADGISQDIRSKSSQVATNTITQNVAGDFYDNSQGATNVGNLINGNRIDESTQAVRNLPQTATNDMKIAADSAQDPRENLEQAATNLANIVQLSRLNNDLTQTSNSSTQKASNTMGSTWNSSGTLRLLTSSQEATNATNLVTAGSVGGGSDLAQTSVSLTQDATNTISGVTTSVGLGSGGSAVQSATNLSNVLSSSGD